MNQLIQSILKIPKKTILLSLVITSTVLLIGFTKWRNKREVIRRKKKKKEGSVNIGGIFGMDIGGTLSKIVYFERKLQSDPHKSDGNNQSTSSVTSNNIQFDQMDSPAHQQALEEFHLAMKSENVMGSSGSRDNALSFYSNILGGRLHFLRFETRKMEMTIQNLSVTDITENIKSIGCTGGGAHKYQHIIHEYLDIDVLTFDELQCLIRGMQFVLMNYSNECYTYRYDKDAEDQEKIWQRDAKEFVRKVQIPYHVLRQSPFPYLVVNIGSGVSILKVTSPGKFERISGTSIGGGTYWGLCRLFTRCSTFEDVLGLAENGDNKGVDMLVSDIYGKGYDQMNLKASMVASSFGKLVMAENPHDGLKEEDLAIALLMMITNNIGQVAYLNARLHQCSRIFFVGNFLRHNKISCRRLAFAINFWSHGTMEAFFLEHEGYFGALGAFLESAFGEKLDDVLLASAKKHNLNDEEHEGEALRFVSNPANKSPHQQQQQRRNTIQEEAPSLAEGTGTGDEARARSRRKKSWRELFQSSIDGRNDDDEEDMSDHSTIPQPPALRRLRTQSLDSHDITPSSPRHHPPPLISPTANLTAAK